MVKAGWDYGETAALSFRLGGAQSALGFRLKAMDPWVAFDVWREGGMLWSV